MRDPDILKREERRIFMRKKILIQAFWAELSDDLAASSFYEKLSDDQKAGVLRYVERSFDGEETVARSSTALNRLRQGRIDFI